MTDFLKSIPDLHRYREYPDPPPIVPGRPDRAWMDATTERFAYRCTPLPIANSSGWELTLPMSFIATWNGGRDLADVQIKSLDGDARLPTVVGSVFGHGVLTFHPGYHFRTSPGWALWVRGAPNTLKDGVVALEGLVETDWLPFTFTMNWRFTRPTTVRFDKGEAFCFLVMTPHGMLDEVQPVVCDISPTTRRSRRATTRGGKAGRTFRRVLRAAIGRRLNRAGSATTSGDMTRPASRSRSFTFRSGG
jgi:hypothetical protein